MDPRLLEYYNRELSYLRETGAEFAARHPKVAARLGMHGTDIADPYVERMVEAFSFLTARTQLKIDAEFPRFTQRLLEVVSPNYVTPTPSMSVAQLHPDPEEGDLAKGFTVPRSTAFFSAIPEGESTACQFRSSQDVTLWPLAIEEARLTAAPPDMPALHRYLPANIHVAGALRITLRTFGELTFSQLAGLDRLPLYLCGEERTASHLFELLHTSAIATLVGVPGHFDGMLDVNLKQPVMYEGLEPDQGLLPLAWNVFHGHNLLHEYFACPERFYFFTPTGLSAGLQKIHGGVAEIVILLNRLPPDWLSHQTDATQLSLFCTPVVNLFPRVTARIDVTHSTTEQHLVVDRTHPLDYEVFSVQEVEGLETDTTRKIAFRQASETTERLQCHARATLNDHAPDFSRLTQLLALLPGAVQSTTPEIPPQPQAEQPENAAIDHTEQIQAEHVVPPVHTAVGISPLPGAEPRQIRDRNDALERLRVIRRWFEHSEPSSPTIPLLRQAERLIGKRFSEVINEIPAELLEKWDALE